MYGKLFQSTYTGSMVGSGPVVFAVWGFVISNCRDSVIELNPPILAASIGCTTEEISTAIDYLCSPDPNSRNDKEEGRRLTKLSAFSYHVTTYDEYQNIRNDEERRAYNRNYMRKYREVKRVNTYCNDGKDRSTHLDLDSNLSTDKKKDQKHVQQAARFEEFWNVYPIKKGKAEAKKRWVSKKLDTRADELIADVLNRRANDKHWLAGYTPHPSTYISGERWQDDFTARPQNVPKTVTIMHTLEAMKNEQRIADSRNGAAPDLPRVGRSTSVATDTGNSEDMAATLGPVQHEPSGDGFQRG